MSLETRLEVWFEKRCVAVSNFFNFFVAVNRCCLLLALPWLKKKRESVSLAARALSHNVNDPSESQTIAATSFTINICFHIREHWFPNCRMAPSQSLVTTLIIRLIIAALEQGKDRSSLMHGASNKVEIRWWLICALTGLLIEIVKSQIHLFTVTMTQVWN